MKINFIVPGIKLNMYKAGGFRIPQIGVLYLATILGREGHEVRIYDENIADITERSKADGDRLREEVLDADAFGISLLTPSAHRGYRFAKQIRERRPGARVVFGGMHASALPEEALEYADCVVVREGENVVKEVFEDSSTQRIVDGGLAEVKELPFPDFDLLNDRERATYFPVLASRGCPYNCNFCQVPITLGRRYRPRDAKSVFEELKERRERGQDRIFFNDDLFGLNRDETVGFLERLVQEGISFEGWTAETRPEIVNKNPEMLELMKRTGCYNIHIGVESASQKSLDAYNKRQTISDIEQMVESAHRQGIKINGMFIIGSDADGKDVVKKTRAFFKRIRMDTATFAILYPIPKTPLFESLENADRILTKNWSLYDGTHVVFKPKMLTPLELQNSWMKIWKKTYTTTNPATAKYSLGLKLYFRNWKVRNRMYLKALKASGRRAARLDGQS